MRAWEEFLLAQEKGLGKDTVDRWLRTLKLVRFDACNLYLKANDSFQALWFEEHIREKVKSSFVNNNNKRIKVHLSVANNTLKEDPVNKKKKKNPQEAPKFSLYFQEKDPYASFSNFISSEPNTLLFKLLCEVAGYSPETSEIGAGPSQLAAFNPIYIHGPSGSGKTHLLMSTAHCLRQQGFRVIYARGETFTEHVVTAIRAGEMQTFRRAYRNIDVLLLDDVQIFSRKGATQEEFFHTFNTLHVEGKQIIISANCAPGELQLIEPRLVSRFEWGIVLPLTPVPNSKKEELLTTRLSAMNFPLTEDLKRYLIKSFASNSKSLCRAVEALALRSHLRPGKAGGKIPLTPKDAEKLLEDLLKDEFESAITPEKIVQATAEFYGIRSEDILSKSQNRECVLPRQVAMYICRKQLHIPYIKLGTIFSRDHSTVISSVRAVEKRMSVPDRELIGSVNNIIKRVQSAEFHSMGHASQELANA